MLKHDNNYKRVELQRNNGEISQIRNDLEDFVVFDLPTVKWVESVQKSHSLKQVTPLFVKTHHLLCADSVAVVGSCNCQL